MSDDANNAPQGNENTDGAQGSADSHADKIYGQQGSEGQEGQEGQEGTEGTQDDTTKQDQDDQGGDSGQDDDSQDDLELSLSEDSLLSDDDLEGIRDFAEEHGLSKEAAQAVLQEKERLLKGWRDGIENAIDQRTNEFLEMSKKDQEIGGEGLAKNAERAKRAIQEFGSDELVSILNNSGYGNHPEIIRVFSKIGKLIEDDSIVMPGKSGAQKTHADILYGKN
jgi:hypothetical protein